MGGDWKDREAGKDCGKGKNVVKTPGPPQVYHRAAWRAQKEGRKGRMKEKKRGGKEGRNEGETKAGGRVGKGKCALPGALLRPQGALGTLGGTWQDDRRSA